MQLISNIFRFELACATDETKLWLSPSANQRRNPFSGPPPLLPDLSTSHEWPVEKAIIITTLGQMINCPL